jgi:hypothetical protein
MMNHLILLAAVVCLVIISVSSSAFALPTRNVPTGIHVALAGDDGRGNSNRIAISWNTVNNTATSTVKYGTVPGKYDVSVTGSSGAYLETFNHHTITENLAPGQIYYYVAGDDLSGWSSEHSFRSAPQEDKKQFSFLAFADLGVYNGDMSTNYINSIKDQVDLVWHGGDVSYADDSYTHIGCFTKFCYEDTIDEYLKKIEPWASKLPYMVAPGNHEANCHDAACLFDADKREKLNNFSAYNGRYRMPSVESGGVLNMHYSFNYGSAHFVSIDTETGYPGAAEEKRYIGLPCGGFADQLTWLEADLKKANENRAQRPWIFVSGHHPMYQGDTINKDFQTAMEDLFYKYGVDVYFAGHVHQYERNYPAYQGAVETTYSNPRATTHVLIGGAGNDEMHNAQVTVKSSEEKGQEEGDSSWRAAKAGANGPWTVVVDADDHVGISKVTIVDDSTLRFDYIRTSNGEVFDTFTLTRDHNKAY